tara:strand:- start:121 stop:1218 length:1098 start_codon:yes stop_codon:yes gene_type:complete
MLTVFSAVASASASVGAGPDQLWSQLAALPILALQSHRQQPAELVTAVADGITESVEKSLFLHMTDEAVIAICANKTADLATRLSAALEKDEDPAAPGSPFAEQRAAADIFLAAAAPSGSALQPQPPVATASSHLELASSPTFGGMAAGAAEATTDALEHVWRLLPDLLMQSIDTQALEALNSMHATALNFAEATLSISDDLAHHRVPAVSGVRAHGANLMQQLLTLSGAWSPGAPAMVQSIVQEQIMAPLNQSSAEAAKRLHELTGEDVGASFEIMLERAPRPPHPSHPLPLHHTPSFARVIFPPPHARRPAHSPPSPSHALSRRRPAQARPATRSTPYRRSCAPCCGCTATACCSCSPTRARS